MFKIDPCLTSDLALKFYENLFTRFVANRETDTPADKGEKIAFAFSGGKYHAVTENGSAAELRFFNRCNASVAGRKGSCFQKAMSIFSTVIFS